MVFEQGFEVFLAVFGEEEGINSGTKLLECKVGGREEGSAGVIGLGDFFEKSSFYEGELEGGKFAGKEFDDFKSGRGWEEEGVDTVDYAVGSELLGVC